MAAPQYISEGTFTAGTGAISVAVPSSYSDGDVFVLLVSTANEAITTPSGWTEVSNSPQYRGTAGAAGGIRLGVFWKYVSGTQSAVAVDDSGSYTAAQIFCFRGCHQTTPINATAGYASTSELSAWYCPSVTTTATNCLILHCIGLDIDVVGSSNISSWTNSNLTNLTEIADDTTDAGRGGGLALACGEMVNADATDGTLVSASAATYFVAIIVAIAPVPGASVNASISETAGVADALSSSLGYFDGASEQSAVGESSDGEVFHTLSADISETVTAGELQTTGTIPTSTGDAYTYLCPNDTTTSISQTVTVPAGTTFVLAYMQARRNPPGNLNEPTLDGKAFTSLGYSAHKLVCFENWKVLKDPTIGAQTLTWSDTSAYCAFIVLLFFKDVDPVNPIFDMIFDAPVFGEGISYANLTGFEYDQLGVTLGFCFPTTVTLDSETYSYSQSVLATCDNYSTAYGHGVVVAPSAGYMHRIYTSNDGEGMSLAAITIVGNRDGVDVVPSRQGETLVTGNTQNGATPDANQNEPIFPLVVEGPFATVASSAPLGIPISASEKLDYSLAVPEGTDVILVFANASSYLSLTDTYMQFYLNGAAFSRVTSTSANSAGAPAVGVWRYASPPSGTQTFGWTIDNINASTYFMLALVFVKGVDTTGDPIVSYGHANPGTAGAQVQITGLTHSPGDLLVGFFNSPVEIPSSPDLQDMIAYPPPPSSMVTYGKVSRDPPAWDGSYGSVVIAMDQSTTMAVTPDPNEKVVGVAVSLKCALNAAIWIDPSSNTNADVAEAISPSSTTSSPIAYVGDGEDSIAPKEIVGKYADLFRGITSSPRTGYYSGQITDTSESTSFGWTGDPPALLVILISSFTWAGECPVPWLEDGAYTLTQNGVQATHYDVVESIGVAYGTSYTVSTLIAYVPNPTPGALSIGINNPHYGSFAEEESDRDLIVAFLVENADVSGVPFRGITISSHGLASGIVSELTLSGISYTPGDMVVGAAITLDELGLGLVGPYPIIGGEFARDMYGGSVDWAYALHVGGTIIGGDSSITYRSRYGDQEQVTMFALVIKFDGDPIGATLSGDDAVSVVADSSSTGVFAFLDSASDSLAGTDASSTIDILLGEATESSAPGEESGSMSGAAATESETTSISSDQTAIRTAAAYFGTHAIIDVTDTVSAWTIGYALTEESSALADIHDGMRLAYGGTVEEVAPGDLLSSERFVDAIAADLLTGWEEAGTTIICWSFAADSNLISVVPTAVADIWAGLVEVSIIADGYSALSIDFYLPVEMTVTYGKVKYTAAYAGQIWTATFNQTELVATPSVQEINAVAGGQAVAALTTATYIATRNEG